MPPHRTVELHLPSLDRWGNAIEREPWVEKAVSLMCSAFGGAYEENVVGHWRVDTEHPLREQTVRIVSYAEEERIWPNLPRLLEFADEFGEATNQEAVMVAIDNQPLVPLPS
ncbi:MAG TPA: hypothetical protein VFN92_08985 [Solirubrobacterales bacterium]|nr:hypothetical protein [Solirubrobacterales bacterium]